MAKLTIIFICVFSATASMFALTTARKPSLIDAAEKFAEYASKEQYTANQIDSASLSSVVGAEIDSVYDYMVKQHAKSMLGLTEPVSPEITIVESIKEQYPEAKAIVDPEDKNIIIVSLDGSDPMLNEEIAR